MKIRGKTIRTLEGLLLSLLIHLLIFLLFFVSFKELKFAPPPPKSKKISLNIKQIRSTPPSPKPQPRAVQPQPRPQPVVTPPVPTPVLPKPVVKKTVKKEPLKEPTPPAKKKLLDEKARLVVEKKETKENNVTKIVKKKAEKPKKKIVKKKLEKKKKKIVKKTRPKRPSRPKSGLAGALMGSGRSVSLAPSRPSAPNYNSSRMIKQLYGSEFDTFTSTQKKFIKKNLGLIHRITQRTLIQNGYPDIAVRTMQEGTNVVTFYLHPNGNITNLRLLSRIGYTALDDNTLQVIRIAYKDYPHPKTRTKITFYVNYSLY